MPRERVVKRRPFADAEIYLVDVISVSDEKVQNRDLSFRRGRMDATPSGGEIAKDLTSPVFIQCRLDKLDVAGLTAAQEFPLIPLIQFLRKRK